MACDYLSLSCDRLYMAHVYHEVVEVLSSKVNRMFLLSLNMKDTLEFIEEVVLFVHIAPKLSFDYATVSCDFTSLSHD